jgi:PKD repeat protein
MKERQFKTKNVFIVLLFILIGISNNLQAQGNCTACFTAIPSASNPLSYDIDATCSSPIGGYTYTYYADGILNNSYPFPFSNINFSTLGTHTISLVISDGTCSDSVSQIVNVTASCDAQFAHYFTNNLGVFFGAYNAGTSSTTFTWDFGDGSTANGISPFHTYSAPGTYNVCLTVTDTALGLCTDTKCDTIVVNNNGAGSLNTCLAFFNTTSNGSLTTYTCNATGSTFDTTNYLINWYVNGVMVQTGPMLIFINNSANIFDFIEMSITDTLGNACSFYSDVFLGNGNGGGGTGGSNGCAACFYLTPLTNLYDTMEVNTTCSITQPGGSVAYSLDGGPIMPVTNSVFTITAGIGYHTIYVYTLDSNGIACDSNYQTYVHIAPPCNSCLAINPVSGSTSNYIFDATCTNLPSTSSSSYLWIVDNNVIATTTNPIFNYNFTQSGTYNVCVNYYDNVTGQFCNQTCSTVVVSTSPATSFNICGSIYKTDSNNWFFNYVPTAASEAKVYLITLQIGGVLDAIDSTTTNAYGQYCFNNVAIGDYRIKAALNSSSPDFSSNIPTYYQSAQMWYDANVVTVFNNNTYGRDIYLIPGINTGGPGFIGGNILQGANKPSRSDLPLDGLTVMLFDIDSNKVIAYTKADIGGTYSFSNIPLGNYKVMGEALNKQSVPALVNLTTSNTFKTGLNLEVNSNIINPAGPSNIQAVEASKIFSMYPNPSTESISITTFNELGGKLSIQDISGKQVLEAAIEANKTNTINIKELQTGIYVVKLYSGGRAYIQKLSKQ